MPPGNSTVFIVLIAVIAAAILLQAGVLVALFIGARQSQQKLMEKIDEIRDDIAPVLSSARDLIEDSGPKIHAIVDNLHATSEHIRTQVSSTSGVVAEVTGRTRDTVAEIAGRTRHQVMRVDGMVTEVLDTVAHGTRLVQDSVLAPLRQVGGWFYAARAILDTLRRPERKSRSSDENMYI